MYERKKRKRHSPEQILVKLREADALLAGGVSAAGGWGRAAATPQPFRQFHASTSSRRVSKGEAATRRIERFNFTLRQRCSRLIRKSLSFSKKRKNHIGAIWCFIHGYNASLAV